MKRLRRRIEQSAFAARLPALVIGLYLRAVNLTTRWHGEGVAALQQDLAHGPVLLVVWHQHLLMVPAHWPGAGGPLISIHDASPIGRAAGALYRHFGQRSMQIDRRRSNLRAARAVLRQTRAGVSAGITGDGPNGPAFALKDAPLDWARAMGCPVYTYAFAHSRQRELDSWDSMALPRPFGRGRYVFRRWTEAPARRSVDDQARLRASLTDLLNETAAAAARPHVGL
ncbi:lysophospholipid acyltransferase family protein [Roseovarius sp. SYSU LYC5161]|jgi:hypothetical protein|uniref:lysophospholipid acyltransferase family protein n=1 Tax=Roseovarius halophilus (ex Wu et al. 2025) TaxID=3376060 RepID=UPI00399B92BE